MAITEPQTDDETLGQDEAVLLTLMYMQYCKQVQTLIIG